MNKSMMMGMVAGIGIATAGGVAGYTYLDNKAQVEETQVAAVTPAAATHATHTPAIRAAAVVPKQECWDEQVTVQVDPKDQHRIGGTAAGAVVGGAIGKKVGDDRDLATVAGAAAGAYIGRRIQGSIQEKNADERAVTTTERRCGPVGSH